MRVNLTPTEIEVQVNDANFKFTNINSFTAIELREAVKPDRVDPDILYRKLSKYLKSISGIETESGPVSAEQLNLLPFELILKVYTSFLTQAAELSNGIVDPIEAEAGKGEVQL